MTPAPADAQPVVVCMWPRCFCPRHGPCNRTSAEVEATLTVTPPPAAPAQDVGERLAAGEKT